MTLRNACWPAAATLMLAACATQDATQSLALATWNLEHLAEATGAGCVPRSEADYGKLKFYAVTLNADVVGLQEVESAVAVHRVFPADTYDVVMSGQPYPAVQGSCGPDGARTFTPQRTAIVIRKGVAYTVNPPLEDLNVSDNPSRPVRWGVDITIEGESPLRILNVHLKSGCASGAKPADDDCPVLFRQVPVVEAWIDARQQEGVAFVVLGDFNRRLGPQDAEVYQAWDDGDPAGLDLHVAAGEVNATPQSPGCNDAKYPDFIDHIVLSGHAFAKVQRGSFAELVFAETGDAVPTDHCPVSVTIGR